MNDESAGRPKTIGESWTPEFPDQNSRLKNRFGPGTDYRDNAVTIVRIFGMTNLFTLSVPTR